MSENLSGRIWELLFRSASESREKFVGELADMLERYDRLQRAAVRVLKDYDDCSGAEPSLSVLHRSVDLELRKAVGPIEKRRAEPVMVYGGETPQGGHIGMELVGSEYRLWYHGQIVWRS